MSQDERATSKHVGWMMEMDGGNKEDYAMKSPSQMDIAPWCYKWIGLGWMVSMWRDV